MAALESSALNALRLTLQCAWVQGREKNPAFSLRAFARKLGISPAAVSELLNSKRGVSRKMAERLLDRLAVAPDERARVLGGRSEQGQGRGPDQGSSPGAGVKRYIELDVDRFRLISDWHHFAILSLAETKDFQSDAKWIAQRLGISVTEATAAIERLVRLGMLKRAGTGKRQRLAATGESYHSTDEVPSVPLRRSHGLDLDLARRALDEDPLDERDFTALTVAIDPKDIPLAKRRIREFRDRLCNELDASSNKREVYKLTCQFFRLTRS